LITPHYLRYHEQKPTFFERKKGVLLPYDVNFSKITSWQYVTLGEKLSLGECEELLSAETMVILQVMFGYCGFCAY